MNIVLYEELKLMLINKSCFGNLWIKNNRFSFFSVSGESYLFKWETIQFVRS